MFGFRSPTALFGVGLAALANMRRRRNARKLFRSNDHLGAYHATSAVQLAWGGATVGAQGGNAQCHLKYKIDKNSSGEMRLIETLLHWINAV